jgi:hypothetical protein
VFTRKKKVEGEAEAPPAFKTTHKYKSRPSVSIATNLKNIRSSFPSLFKK